MRREFGPGGRGLARRHSDARPSACAAGLESREIRGRTGSSSLRTDLAGDDLADYVVRSETRHDEHLAELRRLYGFRSFSGRAAREVRALLDCSPARIAK